MMITINELIRGLNYHISPYFRSIDNLSDLETIHVFRSIKDLGIRGVYVIETSKHEAHVKLDQPVVFVAEAINEEEARKIHRTLWNLSSAPFLIVLLPNQIRVYNSFDYSPIEDKQNGLLLEQSIETLEAVQYVLSAFTAESIDSGNIWTSNFAKKIDTNRKVDRRLLINLRNLAKALVRDDKNPLSLEVANALIGKYVYIRYLFDKKILSTEWLDQNGVNADSVLGRHATINGLRSLIKLLQDRFNGDIFPLDFEKEIKLNDNHVALVASVFKGDNLYGLNIVQRSIDFSDFEAYDFHYLPIELLSSIYELFLHSEDLGRKIGAYYTPEYLASYLLSEVNSIKPLKRGMKVLDPSCGSGIFLVLVYQRLIEIELLKRNTHKLKPEELRDILLESIYGVEREADACSVTEFSLILTLLDYIEPPELHNNADFKFPKLRNSQIFKADFFDNDSEFWKSNLHFDWIVSNPPWIKADIGEKKEKYVLNWIRNNQKEKPIGQSRVVEAFSWRVGEKLEADGVVGLIHHATSLFNATSKGYRKNFFRKHDVFRITNFANLRNSLFEGRAAAPAATIVYRLFVEGREKPVIIHYGPFSVNQIQNIDNDMWVITINENEIQTVKQVDAESGESSVWKLALWGTQRDKRAIERIRNLFPLTLANFCLKRGWPNPAQGADLRDINTGKSQDMAKLDFRHELLDKPSLNMSVLNNKPRCMFYIPEKAISKKTPMNRAYIRKQGGDAGLKLTSAPHIFLSASWNQIIYSETDFVIPSRQMGIATAESSDLDKNYLKALSVYLRSSLVTYYIFFQVPEWGIFLHAKIVSISEVKNIPVPDFTEEQVQQLITLHNELLGEEKTVRDQSFIFAPKPKDFYDGLQDRLDEGVFSILGVPLSIQILCIDFVKFKLSLDQGLKSRNSLTITPKQSNLLAYAKVLRDELDDFMMDKIHHKVTINQSESLISASIHSEHTETQCSVEVKKVDQNNGNPFKDIKYLLSKQESQWVYVQRSLRVFDNDTITIYKLPYVINWTRAQALNDSMDVIAEILSLRG